MKKKIVALVALVSITLTGCGGIDYTDPNVYYDMYTETVNEIDPTYLTGIKELIASLGIEEQATKFKDDLFDAYAMVLDNTPQEYLEQGYDYLNEQLSAAETLEDLGIMVTTDDINKVITEFEKLGENVQTQISTFFDSIITLYDEAVVGTMDKAKEMTKEQLEAAGYYDLEDAVKAYIEETDLQASVDEVQKNLEDALKISIF